MQLASTEAESRLDASRLLPRDDRHRDFEAPQHVAECHQDDDTSSHVDYGLKHGAHLMIDIEDGRFVFFYRDALRE